MNNNKPTAFINTLTPGMKFRLQGDGRDFIPVMTVESRVSEGGRTVLTVRLPNGAGQRFHRPGLTVVEIVK